MKKRKTAAKIIGTALALSLLQGCSALNSSSDTKSGDGSSVKFNIGHLPATGHILYFIAYEEGFFKDEGLDVTLYQFDNNPQELAALESGKIDIAPINATNLINFIAGGHELTSIGGVMSDGHAIVVSPDVVDGVDPEDYSLDLLKGKSIVLQSGSTYDIEFRIALRDAGFDLEKDIEILNTESGTAAYNSLKNNDIDGAAIYAPFRQKAIDEGFVPLIYCDEIEYFDHPICCRDVALSESISSDPEVYKSFTRAMIRASEFLDSDHEGSIADAKKYLDIDEDILEHEIYNHSINNPDPDEKKTVTFYNAMKELGFVETEINISDYVNNDIYESALNELADENSDNKFYQDLIEYHKSAVV